MAKTSGTLQHAGSSDYLPPRVYIWRRAPHCLDDLGSRPPRQSLRPQLGRTLLGYAVPLGPPFGRCLPDQTDMLRVRLVLTMRMKMLFLNEPSRGQPASLGSSRWRWSSCIWTLCIALLL